MKSLLKRSTAEAAQDRPTKSPANPEGKGVSVLLRDWQATMPRGVAAKPTAQLLAELFTSMLVLSASFKYRPVPESANYLYWVDGHWSLSLIAPEEWSEKRRAGFAGVCMLQRDMTWTIEPSSRLAERSPVAMAVRQFFAGFSRMLNTELSLEDVLPFYAPSLAYYQRLYASALSRSVNASLRQGGQVGLRGKEWRRLLALPGNGLPLQIGFEDNPRMPFEQPA